MFYILSGNHPKILEIISFDKSNGQEFVLFMLQKETVALNELNLRQPRLKFDLKLEKK